MGWGSEIRKKPIADSEIRGQKSTGSGFASLTGLCELFSEISFKFADNS
jgi:hypothetical protein